MLSHPLSYTQSRAATHGHGSLAPSTVPPHHRFPALAVAVAFLGHCVNCEASEDALQAAEEPNNGQWATFLRTSLLQRGVDVNGQGAAG